MFTQEIIAGITLLVCVLIVAAYLLGRHFGNTSCNAETKRVYNVDRKFGSLLYYEVVRLNGKWCFFTDNDLREAHNLADNNQEDIPH